MAASRFALIVLAALLPCAAFAASVEITPRVGLEIVFTDNVELATLGEEEADHGLIGSLGVRLREEGTRTRLALDVNVERLKFFQNADRDAIRTEATGSGTAGLPGNWLFLDVQTAVRQAFINPEGGISRSRFNNTENRVQVEAYRISPFVRRAFGSWAAFELRYAQTLVQIDTESVDDTRTHEFFGVLSSGPHFVKFDWALTLNGEFSERENDPASRSRRLASFDARYRLVGALSVLAGAGYEDIRDDALPERIAGPISSFGFLIEPSPRSRLRATVNHRFDDVLFGAEMRVGLGARTAISARHDEGLQTSQRLITTGLGFLGTDPQGDLLDLRNELPFAVIDPAFGLVEGTFRQRRTSGRIERRSPRDTFWVDVFKETRFFELFLISEKAHGGQLSWAHRFSHRNSGLLGLASRETDFGRIDGRVDRFRYANLTFTRRLSPHLNARFNYTHSERLSNIEEGNLLENAYLAGLHASF